MDSQGQAQPRQAESFPKEQLSANIVARPCAEISDQLAWGMRSTEGLQEHVGHKWRVWGTPIFPLSGPGKETGMKLRLL